MVDITKAPLAKEEIKLKRDIELKYWELAIEADPYPDQWKLNFYEKLTYWLHNGAKYSKLVFTIINLITKIGITMSTSNDKKTTRTSIVKGIITAIVSIVTIFFSADIDPEMQATLIGVIVGIWGIFDWIQGYFTNKPDEDK